MNQSGCFIGRTPRSEASNSLQEMIRRKRSGTHEHLSSSVTIIFFFGESNFCTKILFVYNSVMIILGIDPGYGTCGYGVLQKESRNLSVLNYGVIKTTPKEPFVLRLEELAEDFEELLKTYKPEVVAIEDLYFAQNVTTGLQVSQVRGIFMYLAHKHGARVTEPKPSEVKSHFCGDGQASKAQMKKMVETIFKIPAKGLIDDAADALAVAHYAAYVH